MPLIVGSVKVDETLHAHETPERYLERVVADKLAEGLVIASECAAVLVADTVVVGPGPELLGKPRDRREAVAMIGALAGREHDVMTRFAWRATDGQEHVETVTTRVWFRPLAAAEIERYVSTDEGRDKAGAYAIQGIGATLVSRIEGSYTNVVGLPLAEVIASLAHAKLYSPSE